MINEWREVTVLPYSRQNQWIILVYRSTSAVDVTIKLHAGQTVQPRNAFAPEPIPLHKWHPYFPPMIYKEISNWFPTPPQGEGKIQQLAVQPDIYPFTHVLFQKQPSSLFNITSYQYFQSGLF